MANHIAINMLNEAIDDNKAKKSNRVCDHSSYHKFIPASWENIVHEEVQKGWRLGIIMLLEKLKMKNRYFQKTFYFLNLFTNMKCSE